MNTALAVIGSLVAIGGGIPYIIDTIKGKTRPNIVTWFTWSLLNIINAFAALSDGALQTAIFSFAAAFITIAIVVLGLRHGVKKYTRFDAICQVVALFGIALWLMTNQPALAVLIVLLIDFAGGLPTLRHAYKAPYEETLVTFICSAIATGMVLLSLQQYTFVAVALPLYIFLFDMTLTIMIITRRRKLYPEVAHA